MPCYTQNITIALQNHPWYTRRRPSGFLTRPCNQSKSSHIEQIRRSIFLSSSLLSALCRNVGNSYPTPILRVYVVYMRVCIVQQFTVFTENVEKASPFLSETCLHRLSDTNVVIFANCTISEGSRDSRLPPHSSRILLWPAKWKILPRLCGPVKYVLTPWSRIQKSLKL